MEDDDTKIDALREFIRQWKIKNIFTGLSESTDQNIVSERANSTRALARKLISTLEDDVPADEETQPFFQIIGSPCEWPLRIKAQSVIFSDLFEYPMTPNKGLITKLKDEHIKFFE